MTPYSWDGEVQHAFEAGALGKEFWYTTDAKAGYNVADRNHEIMSAYISGQHTAKMRTQLEENNE